MIRKYHNHTLQTNPQYCEEEQPQNTNEDPWGMGSSGEVFFLNGAEERW